MAEMAEMEEAHWPQVPIEDVSDEERKGLLLQAGPAGEAARVQWQQYQEARQRATVVSGPIAEEYQRLAEAGEIPPSSATAAPETEEEGEEGEDEEDEEGQEDDEEDMARALAQQKAEALGYEIRDWGSQGEWRVYDPKTGRLVSKAVLEG